MRDYSVRYASQQELLEPAESSGPDNYQISAFLDCLIDYCFYDGGCCLGNVRFDNDFTFLGLGHGPINYANSNPPGVLKIEINPFSWVGGLITGPSEEISGGSRVREELLREEL